MLRLVVVRRVPQGTCSPLSCDKAVELGIMSRTGKNPVDVPKGVKVDAAANKVSLEGPKGKLDLNIPHWINV